MTTFETIIVIIYYLFAWAYMCHAFCIQHDKKWWASLITMLVAATIGIAYFPVVFAEDIWHKLNIKHMKE